MGGSAGDGALETHVVERRADQVLGGRLGRLLLAHLRGPLRLLQLVQQARRRAARGRVGRSQLPTPRRPSPPHGSANGRRATDRAVGGRGCECDGRAELLLDRLQLLDRLAQLARDVGVSARLVHRACPAQLRVPAAQQSSRRFVPQLRRQEHEEAGGQEEQHAERVGADATPAAEPPRAGPPASTTRCRERRLRRRPRALGVVVSVPCDG